ncbi:MAG: prepilin-type cleavage/methylation domain-containing protein [Variovorax paradoxus]|uniref:Prepilin-type cleavage/methylation domain-containing protein n=1 Tax=Variovorax paradoxus TaxID=34073 RepID=A0A2W5RXI2_VARPD|nr:MAG: prepilin-type cleavage/methylation domain-containing protein [Variovorax paradoxus]
MKGLTSFQGLRRLRQRGFTLVELLVALALTLVIMTAAVATLIVARRGFSTVDAVSQLDENTRFTTEILRRTIAQAGFLDVAFATATTTGQFKVAKAAAALPMVQGYNDAQIPDSPVVEPFSVNGSRSSCPGAAGTACKNGSDVLIVRAQAAARNAKEADGVTTNCRGSAEPTVPADASDVITSIFFVRVDTNTGEPTLMCHANGTNSKGENRFAMVPLVSGVESFQALYGVDGVDPGKPMAAADSVVDRYLRADQLDVPGNAEATKANWERVRAIKIGLVLRGPANSAQDSVATTKYPFGVGGYSSAADPGTALAAPADGRLRQAVNFTVYLHNPQVH